MRVSASPEPLVSVLVSSYNHESFVSDLLNSLLDQTYLNIELLLIDDCSTDRTYDVVKAYEADLNRRFTRVVLERNSKNQGLTANLNELLKGARGSYIKLIASDDFLRADAIGLMVQYMESHKECDSLFTNVLYVDIDDRYPVICDSGRRIGYDSVPDIGEGLHLSLLEKGDHILVTGRMDRASTYERFGLFDESISIEDWEYWLRFSKSGGVLGYIEAPIAMYRQTPDSLSRHSTSVAGKLKFERVTSDEMAILETYLSDQPQAVRSKAWRTFVSKRVIVAMDVGSSEYVHRLIEEAKKNGAEATIKTRICLLLYKLGLFHYIHRAYLSFKGV